MESKPRSGSLLRMGSVVILAVVVTAGSLVYIQWTKGAFRKHEKIAIVTWTEDPFWGPTQDGAEDAAKDLGVELTFIRSKPDEQSQNQHIHDVLASGVDGLAISPNNPKTLGVGDQWSRRQNDRGDI